MINLLSATFEDATGLESSEVQDRFIHE